MQGVQAIMQQDFKKEKKALLEQTLAHNVSGVVAQRPVFFIVNEIKFINYN